MERDKLFNRQKCFSAIVKKDMRDLDLRFFTYSKDPECTDEMYEMNYNKDIDKIMKQVATKYYDNLEHVNFAMPSSVSDSKYHLMVHLLR